MLVQHVFLQTQDQPYRAQRQPNHQPLLWLARPMPLPMVAKQIWLQPTTR